MAVPPEPPPCEFWIPGEITLAAFNIGGVTATIGNATDDRARTTWKVGGFVLGGLNILSGTATTIFGMVCERGTTGDAQDDAAMIGWGVGSIALGIATIVVTRYNRRPPRTLLDHPRFSLWLPALPSGRGQVPGIGVRWSGW